MNLSLDAGEVVGSPVGGKCLPPILPKSVHRHAEKAMNNNTRQQAGTVGEERQATGERRAEHSGHNLVKEASQRPQDELEDTEHDYPLGAPAAILARAKLSKLVVDPSAEHPHWRLKAGPLLIACVTVCNESYMELQYCLETFQGRFPTGLNLGMVYVFLDACPDEEMQDKNESFQALVSLMGLEVSDGKAPMEEGGCRVYRGMLGFVQARLYVKGRGDFQKSKRRSITAFYRILAARIASGVSDAPVAVLHLDGDTGSALPKRDNAESGYGLQNVGKMMQIMENCKNLGAIASQVRILQRSKNALTLMQSFDCSTTYVGVFGGSSLIGRSIACFGMAVMYRYSALLESKVEGIPAPLKAFSRTPGKHLVDLVNLDMNEDQGMTTFVMRAGYDTKVCVVTRFYTYAPETLAELMGQRRRWQAGYFVGMPSQVFGWPSPHLQVKKYRWLMAFIVMTMWTNAFLLPGTVGVGLALIFGKAYEGFWYQHHVAGKATYTSGTVALPFLLPEAMFAAGVWAFWLLFMAMTMDKAPKEVRHRCRFFFAMMCLFSVGLCVVSATVSSGVQMFLILMIGLNLTVGLALTYDWREWPHRLQEIILYVIFLYAVQPMITMYAVANIDSALWGTRSIGDVNATAKALDGPQAPARSRRRKQWDVRRKRKGRLMVAPQCTVSEGTQGTEDGSEWDDGSMYSNESDDSGETAYYEYFNRQFKDRQRLVIEDTSSANGLAVGEPWRAKEDFSLPCGEGKKVTVKESQAGKRRCYCRSKLSLRTRKFVVMTAWILLNMAVTVVFLLWRLHLVVVLNFFSNFAGLVTIVVAARVEAYNQRQATKAPQPPQGWSGASWNRSVPPSTLPTLVVSWDGCEDGVDAV